MSTALIKKRESQGAESGDARRQWELTFAQSEPKRADPLTGWAGSGDTRADQIRLYFPSKEAAVAYCEKQGYDFTVVPETPKRIKLQSYADNFR